MVSNHNEDSNIKKTITLVLITGLIGFFIGLLGDFVKIALTDLKNYNAVKIKTEKEFTDKSAEVRFEIYKLGNKPSSFDFDFATENGIQITSRPDIRQISESVLHYGEIKFKDDDIENGDFVIYFKDMHKYDKFEVVVMLSATDETKLKVPFYRINVKTEDPSIKGLEAGCFDFIFKWPVYVTAILIAIILLSAISFISYFIIGALINERVIKTNEQGVNNENERVIKTNEQGVNNENERVIKTSEQGVNNEVEE